MSVAGGRFGSNAFCGKKVRPRWKGSHRTSMPVEARSDLCIDS